MWFELPESAIFRMEAPLEYLFLYNKPENVCNKVFVELGERRAIGGAVVTSVS
jgi:hypothetical protein